MTMPNRNPRHCAQCGGLIEPQASRWLLWLPDSRSMLVLDTTQCLGKMIDTQYHYTVLYKPSQAERLARQLVGATP